MRINRVYVYCIEPIIIHRSGWLYSLYSVYTVTVQYNIVSPENFRCIISLGNIKISTTYIIMNLICLI